MFLSSGATVLCSPSSLISFIRNQNNVSDNVVFMNNQQVAVPSTQDNGNNYGPFFMTHCRNLLLLKKNLLTPSPSLFPHTFPLEFQYKIKFEMCN